MKKLGNWLWGLVLVALGVILGMNALGWTRIDVFFPGWWTLFIIVPCAIGLITEKHKTGSLIGLLIGVCFLLGCLGILSFDIVARLFLPVILVIIGLSIMFKGASQNKAVAKIKEIRKEHGDDYEGEEYWATFGGQNLDFKGKEFKGCRLEAIFGGIDLDLRGAKIQDTALIKSTSIFGSTTIHVPDDVKVEYVSTSIFGGVDDERKKKAEKTEDDGEEKEAKKTLFIEATCVFGGTDLK